MFIDSHCHLDRLDYENIHQNIADVVAKAEQANVTGLLSIGITLDEFEHMIDMIEPFDQIWASCGVHPLDVTPAFDIKQVREFAQYKKVIAIGETGLDYYYQTTTAKLQQKCFSEQIELAIDLDKPLIVHTRKAKDDTLAILKESRADKCSGIIHCFTEDLAFAKKVLDLGFYISISGIVTFPKATQLQEVVKSLPLDRLLIETDAPYLAPIPYRGKENQPAYVVEVAAKIAQLKNSSFVELGVQTTNNFKQLFGI